MKHSTTFAGRFLLAAGAAGLLATGAFGPALAQRPQAEPAAPAVALPRLPDGHPDLQGLWLKSNGGYFGLFIGSLDGTNFAAGGGGGGRGAGPPPAGPQYEYLPEAAAEQAYRAERSYEDPEGRCHLPGVPRALDQPAGLYPVQIIQDEKYVALLHEAMHDVRIIPTDNSPHPTNYWAWDGDSRGRWEGDTFIVDVSNFNGRTWLDMSGNFVDENEHVLERFTHDRSRHDSLRGHRHGPTVFVKPVEFRLR